ncbi:MAG TPA: glycoside hydrolase family 9 protein [Brevibacillus sp.]|nr:glycoside hydrolase family 9 protein [Brevibacillus sp.]
MLKREVRSSRWTGWMVGLALLLAVLAVLYLIRVDKTSPPHLVNPLPATREIGINQAGYAPSAVKIAYTTTAVGEFSLVDLQANQAVFRGVPTISQKDRKSGKPVYQMDFSSFQRPGFYQLQLSNGRGSVPFAISGQVYQSIYQTVMRSYELQRCGIALADPVSHVHHEACHLAPAQVIGEKGGERDVTGGWHDAGDYGKYTANAGMTTAQLLLAYELAPMTLKNTSLFLPRAEEEKSVAHFDEPDTLAVIRVELDWMRKMQREDGAVHHSVKTAEFPGMILPEEDRQTQYLYPVSTPDTAIFSAAMARAARVYHSYDEPYAQMLLDAAKKAWAFLERSHELLVPETVQAYRIKSDKQSRVWAAAELYFATGDVRYRSYVEQNLGELELRPKKLTPSYWQNTSAMTVITLALHQQTDWELTEQMRQLLLHHADQVVNRINQTAYGTVLQARDYDWASTKTALGYGVHLAVAHQLEPKPAYVAAISRQLDWVLGANPLAQSFVTGIGMFSPVHPHHRYSAASGILVPGLLVGGPNTNANDNVAPPNQGAKSYIDDVRSFATNEYAIDYNAPLVVVAGFLHERRN